MPVLHRVKVRPEEPGLDLDPGKGTGLKAQAIRPVLASSRQQAAKK